MKLNEIKDKLQTVGIPVSYLKFPTPQQLPYCVFCVSGQEIRGADQKSMIETLSIAIELYSDKKRTDIETQIESIFDGIEITKNSDVFLPDENMIMTVFEFDTINKRTEV